MFSIFSIQTVGILKLILSSVRFFALIKHWIEVCFNRTNMPSKVPSDSPPRPQMLMKACNDTALLNASLNPEGTTTLSTQLW